MKKGHICFFFKFQILQLPNCFFKRPSFREENVLEDASCRHTPVLAAAAIPRSIKMGITISRHGKLRLQMVISPTKLITIVGKTWYYCIQVFHWLPIRIYMMGNIPISTEQSTISSICFRLVVSISSWLLPRFFYLEVSWNWGTPSYHPAIRFGFSMK